MKITNYNRKLEEEKTTGKNLFSDPHIIQGFNMRLEIYLNGSGDGKGTHLAVFLQLMKGELDDILMWPFDKIINIVLIHPDDKSKYLKRSLTKALRNKYNMINFLESINGVKERWGHSTFISQERLHTGGFIKNDSLYIRCIIE